MTDQTTVNKKITLQLVGLDGNAFALIGAFQRQARAEGWTPDEIKAVRDEMSSGDYAHLLQTLMRYTESPAATDADDDVDWKY